MVEGSSPPAMISDIFVASFWESILDTTNVAAWSTSVPLAIHLLRRAATSVLPPAETSALRKRRCARQLFDLRKLGRH